MATLVKDSRSRSPFWTCCYTAADGRRLKKSTKQTDRAKAMEFCLTLQRTEDMAARGTLTETRARELIGEVLERTSGETVAFYTAEGWLRDWLRGKEVSRVGRHSHKIRAHRRTSFITHLGAQAKLNIAAISGPRTWRAIGTTADCQRAKASNTVRYHHS